MFVCDFGCLSLWTAEFSCSLCWHSVPHYQVFQECLELKVSYLNLFSLSWQVFL